MIYLILTLYILQRLIFWDTLYWNLCNLHGWIFLTKVNGLKNSVLESECSNWYLFLSSNLISISVFFCNCFPRIILNNPAMPFLEVEALGTEYCVAFWRTLHTVYPLHSYTVCKVLHKATEYSVQRALTSKNAEAGLLSSPRIFFGIAFQEVSWVNSTTPPRRF